MKNYVLICGAFVVGILAFITISERNRTIKLGYELESIRKEIELANRDILRAESELQSCLSPFSLLKVSEERAMKLCYPEKVFVLRDIDTKRKHRMSGAFVTDWYPAGAGGRGSLAEAREARR